MTLLLPFRSSFVRLGRYRVASQLYNNNSAYRFFSTSENALQNPLILWIESKDTNDAPTLAPPPRILMPPSCSTTKVTVSSPQQVLEAVDAHYSLAEDHTEGEESKQQFVGGMGESDAGVYFACDKQDPLHHYQLIQDAIQQTKEYRHGVPFGVFTSGVNLPADLPPLSELGLKEVQVSLLASNPAEYAQATGLSSSEAMKAFGQVCGFCVTVSETGFPLQTSVLQPFASSARELATSLGAVKVNVFDD